MTHVIYGYLLPIKCLNIGRTVPNNANSSKLNMLRIGVYPRKLVFTKA